jgi:hydroxymethylbilane synthase
MRALRLGTRGSALALAQAEEVGATLRGLGERVDLVVVKTRGDLDQDRSLSQMAGPGVFSKELEAALARGEVDLAVHSCKDLPARLPPPLVLAAVPRRADARDCLVGRAGIALQSLDSGATVATGSARRRALVARARPDLQLADLRGNLDTRLAKLDAGFFDAIVVARAGLVRLGRDDRASEVLPAELFVPAPGQGALAIEARSDATGILAMLAEVDDPASHAAVRAERALLAAIGSGCRAPIGAFAEVSDGADEMTVRACMLSPDGAERIDVVVSGPPEDAAELGSRAASALLGRGGDALLRGIGRG